MVRLIFDLVIHRYAVYALISSELKTSVATTRIGALWWFLDPIIMMLVYYFIVEVIFQRGGPNYHLFVLCGIIPWRLFSSGLQGGVKGIENNELLIKQINLPLHLYVLIQPVVRTYLSTIGVSLILIMGYKAIGLNTLLVIPIMVTIMLLTYGLALIFTVISIYIPDVHQILHYVLRAGFFLSPVLFPASKILDSERVPEVFKVAFAMNPLAWLFTALRTVVLEGKVFGWKEFTVFFIVVLFVVQIGLMLMKLSDNKIRKMV